jgi:hypothetical protein
VTGRPQPTHDLGEADQVDWLIRKLRPQDGSHAPGRMAPIGARPKTVVRHVYVPMRPATVRICVWLGVGLGVALPYWPYANTCGWSLVPYYFAVGMVGIAGLWSARLTWGARLGFSHTIALLTVLWGLALALHHLLPRLGYARTSAPWFCSF